LNLHLTHSLGRAARSLALGLTALAACGLAAASGYSFTRFEDPRGPSTSFFPTGINNAYDVTGTVSFEGAFRLTGINDLVPGATITTFNVPAAFNGFTFGDDINNDGVIVGAYRNGTGAHGFILDGGVFTTVDLVGANRDTLLTGINDVGQTVGQYRDATTGNFLGFVQDGANVVLLDASQPQPNTFVQGINNAGRVVGSVGGGGSPSRGFTFAGGVYEFFDAPGAFSTQAFGINNAGVVVGTASTGLFVKDGASFTTFNLPASWNARDAYATDITDDGVVVGYFTDNGTNLTYGFLATPTAVPEPASALLMLGGALALLASRRAAMR
jgi:hypothetical protein